MLEFASKMEFEKAAEARDKIKELEKLLWFWNGDGAFFLKKKAPLF